MTSLIQPAPIEQVVRQFARSAARFDTHAEVFRVVSERLQTRLDLLAIEPQVVVDLGSRTGYQLRALQARSAQARVLGLDPAPCTPISKDNVPDNPPGSNTLWSIFRRRPAGGGVPEVLAADPHRLPLADASVDLVVSNLLLPWCHSPHRVFAEVARVLAPGGAFLFSSAGPDTLLEYRAAWATIDAHLHGFGLLDMHDLGDAMLAAGFAAPVLDRENLIIDYPSIDALQHELRGLGAANIALGRRVGLMSPQVRIVLNSRVDPDARFPVTLELVQGHAWKGDLASSGEQTGDGYTVSLESFRRSLKR